MRAARGLLESKLTSPQAISDAPLEEEVEALHSEGNVQRGVLGLHDISRKAVSHAAYCLSASHKHAGQSLDSCL